MRRDLPTVTSLLALGIVAVVLVLLGFRSGGYFPRHHLTAGAAVLLAAAVALAVATPRREPTRVALVAFGSLALLTAWTGLSASWSPQADEALVDFRLDLAYLGLFVIAMLAAGSGRLSPFLPWTALAVCVVVVGAGLLSRIQPDLVTGTVGDRVPSYRLSYPLTYWNAFGALAAFGATLAAGLASDARAAPWTRGLAAGLAVPLLVAVYLSLSRGAWIALVVASVVFVVLTPYRASALLTTGVIGALAAVCAVRLGSLDALTDDPTAGSGQQAEGDAFTPLLVLMSLAAAAGGVLLGGARRSVPVGDLAARLRPKVLAASAGAVLTVAVLGYAVQGEQIEGRSARAVDDVGDWIDRQWNDFLQVSTFSQEGTERLTTSRGTRSDLYRVAIDGFQDHPLRGDGAGGFEWRWYQTREAIDDTREPHSLLLGTLGELGLVGALLLLSFLGALGVAAVRGVRRSAGLRRGQTAAVAAACSVWVVHVATDWGWQMPAVTGTALLAAAALLPPGVSRRRRRQGRA